MTVVGPSWPDVQFVALPSPPSSLYIPPLHDRIALQPDVNSISSNRSIQAPIQHYDV
jgi:hypothetical protein